nr:MAG TPA: hypothetical protein [Caudoviricetes sp.]
MTTIILTLKIFHKQIIKIYCISILNKTNCQSQYSL